jgi:hypothetical protein
MMQVKGSAIAFMPKIISKKYGEDALYQWLAKLSPYARELYISPISPQQWFPLKEALVEPTAIICQMFHNWDLQGAWELGRYSAEFGLRGIYKFFIRFGSPEFLINKAGDILPTYYEPSAIEVVNQGRGMAQVRITRFPEIDRIIEMRIGGWMQAALEICGCQNVRVEITKSLTRFQSCTEYEILWDGK